MPDIARVLKEEIQRIARKEVKAATTQIQKTNATLRRSVADLKRRLAAIEKGNKLLVASAERARKVELSVSDKEGEDARITAKMLKKMRARLGLTQTDLAYLIDSIPVTVGRWEQKEGRLSFRGTVKARIVEISKLTKAEAQNRLDEMSE